MITISISNQKGGCCKTTTTTNLAYAIANLKKKVLVIDLDPQQNTSEWLSDYCTDEIDLFDVSSLDSVLQKSSSDLLCISNKFNRQARGLDDFTSYSVDLFRRNISNIRAQSKWDFIIFDTPPTLNNITNAALTCSNFLIIPVLTHVLSLSGVAQLIDHLNSDFSSDIKCKILGVLPCRVDFRTKHSKEVIDSLKIYFKELVFSSFISENIKLAEAPSFKMPIQLYSKSNRAVKEFHNLALELIQRVDREMQ